MNIEFQSAGSTTTLRGRFHRADSGRSKSPLVIMMTGDGPKGTKSLSWVNMPPLLEKFGISSFLFDFEGLGYSSGERRVLTVSRGLDNFQAAYRAAIAETWVDAKRIGAFASSYGAAVLLLSPDCANTMKAIGLKSPASFLPDAYFNEIGPEAFDAWRREGFCAQNAYDFQVLKDSLLHNVYQSAGTITPPCLITQGACDEIIALQHTKYLYECLGSTNKRLEVFEGASHGYSEGNSWNRMAAMFTEWFASLLVDGCDRKKGA